MLILSADASTAASLEVALARRQEKGPRGSWDLQRSQIPAASPAELPGT